MNPLVSVVIPVYNAGKYLRAALNSILQQTYKNLEIICVDDGSTDNSLKILKEFQKYDPRIQVYKNNKNRGIGYTANLLNKLAKGNYLARMDADDISLLDRIEKQVKFLENNPDTVAVGGQCVTIDENNFISGFKVFPLKHKDIYKMIFTAVPIQQPTMMINRKLLPKNYQWYNNHLSPIDDLDFYFRLFSFGKLANLPDFILKYREYLQSSSLKDPKRSFNLTFKVRKNAVKEYGYVTTLKARILNGLQYLAVTLLPTYSVFPIFRFFRRVATKNLFDHILTLQIHYPTSTKRLLSYQVIPQVISQRAVVLSTHKRP